jgi:CheY-like chemotaxis protein
MIPDICILVVDDNVEILASFQQSLNELGKRFRQKVEIKVAKNVLEALKSIRQHRVDAIFLDYHFDGGMSGDELLDFLPSYLDSLYIALISGKNEQELTQVVTKRHIKLNQNNFPFRYLSKPVSNLQLQDVYQSIVGFINKRPLPSTLAYTARAIDESESNLAKLTAIKDFLETTMKYLTSILVSDAFHRKSRKLLQRQINKNVGYGFGVWLGWLRELYEQEKIGSNDDFIPEIWEFLSEPLFNQETPLKFLNMFKDIRDQKLGHGFVNEEAYYKSLIDELSKSFTQFRERLHFCTRYPLLAIEEINFSESNSDSFKYRVRVLMGLESRPATREICSRLRLKKNNVYLADPLGQFLMLHPFINFELCPKCDLRRVFMMDTTRGNQLSHVALCNHRRESQADFKALQMLITLPDNIQNLISVKDQENPVDVYTDQNNKALLDHQALNNQSSSSDDTKSLISMNVPDEAILRNGVVLQNQRDQVFISYSHKDKKWLQELKIMLAPLIRKQTILAWDDSKIEAGSEWRKEIENALNSAKVAILMVSPNFLESEFIAERELPQLLKASREEGLTVLWVHISHSMYKETEIETYQAAHDPSQPLSGLSRTKRDRVLVQICNRIQKVFNS